MGKKKKQKQAKAQQLTTMQAAQIEVRELEQLGIGQLWTSELVDLDLQYIVGNPSKAIAILLRMEDYQKLLHIVHASGQDIEWTFVYPLILRAFEQANPDKKGPPEEILHDEPYERDEATEDKDM